MEQELADLSWRRRLEPAAENLRLFVAGRWLAKGGGHGVGSVG